MKRLSIALLAAVTLMPLGSLVLNVDAAQARGVRRNNTIAAANTTGARPQKLAQRGDSNLTPEQRAAKQAEREAKMTAKMKETLGLSDAQVSQIEGIRASFKPQFESLRTEAKALKDSGATKEQMQPIRDKMKALHEQMQASIKGVLSADQVQKLDAMKAQWGDRKHGNRQGGRQNRQNGQQSGNTQG